MNAKQAREWIKDAPANPNPKTDLAGFGFQRGGDDPESRETSGGPWFLCAECAGRLQARGCGFSSKEAGPIWEGQIHEDCAVCGPALLEALRECVAYMRHESRSPFYAAEVRATKQAMAAIAQAEGGAK